jgi:outer membrane immunogenic protein
MKQLKTGIAVFLTLFIMTGIAAAKDNHPAATLKFVERGVALGFGISWGEGTLYFKGKNYPFKIHGLSINDIGISEMKATGKVYDLKKIEDFSGTYNALGSESTMGEGVGAIMMKNEKGVSIEIIVLSEGARVKLSVGGVELKLK